MNQLPTYLQQLQPSGLAARAAEGIGSALPPHISIRGNAFTLVDAAGNKQTAQTTFLDVCIADISDVMCKQFYENDWSPDSDEPPACWSANGVAPSVEAIKPQSATCATCPQNVRGSDVSRLSNKPIKACRDEKWLAVLVPGVPMPLQLKLTPGSFTNFRGYVEMFKGKPIDMCHVFTRLQFEANKNGVLTFTVSPTGYIDQPTAEMYVKMKTLKASDVLVGRTDQPRLPAGNAATQGGTGQAPLLARPDLTGTSVMQNQPQGFQPAPFGDANTAVPPNTALQNVTQGQVANQPIRRRRRTAEQIAADNAAAGGQTTVATGFAQPGAQQSMAAPFAQGPAPAGQFGGPAAGAPPFGIAVNAPPPPAGLDDALNQLFKGQ